MHWSYLPGEEKNQEIAPDLLKMDIILRGKKKHVGISLEVVLQITGPGTSMVAQWLISTFPLQENLVQSLVGELRTH